MKTSQLIQALRRQAVDDAIGVICCHPPEQARTYFQLALDLAAPPAPVRALADKLETLLASPSYATWRRLFDLVEEWQQSAKAPVSSLKMLTDVGRQAAREGASAKLEQALALYADCAGLWPEGWSDFLPGLARELRAAHPVPGPARAAARLVLLGAWEKEGLPGPWGAATLQALRRSLAQPPLVADAAADLLEHLREPKQLAAAWTTSWRRALAQCYGQPSLMAPILEESRTLLPVLQAGADYDGLYQAAVQAVALSDQDCGEAMHQLLVAGHPHPEGLSSLLSLRAALEPAWDADSWRAFACALCREPEPARRQARAQSEVERVLSRHLRTRPATWPAAVEAAGKILPVGFPPSALRDQWMTEAAAFPDLSAEHIRALGKLAGPAAAGAAQPWCALGEALGDRLRPADRRAWFGIALDLLAATLSWNPAALAEITAHWRGFVQTLLLAQSGYAAEANRIMACQRETLDGPLFDACAALRPHKTAAELDTLKTCGVGIGRA